MTLLRTMMTNTKRAEELGLAALPATLTGPSSAPLGSGTLQGSATSSPALGPVAGQGSWYRTGLHMLPEELNAAVLEALAAEAAGIEHKANRYITLAEFPYDFLFSLTRSLSCQAQSRLASTCICCDSMCPLATSLPFPKSVITNMCLPDPTCMLV